MILLRKAIMEEAGPRTLEKILVFERFTEMNFVLRIVLFLLSPVGKELSKEYEGYRTEPTTVPESDQDTGYNWHKAAIVKSFIKTLFCNPFY